MKRTLFAAVLACATLIGIGLTRPAHADVTFGYPFSYTPVQDLNAVGASYTVYNIGNAGYCKVSVYAGVPFVASLDVYTSVLGTFADAVKQGSLITAPATAYVNISGLAPHQPAAIRVQTRAFTSGDPLVAVDCKGGLITTAIASPAPTPAATP